MLNKRQLYKSYEKSSIREKKEKKFILEWENEYSDYLDDVSVEDFSNSVYLIVNKIINTNKLEWEESVWIKKDISYSHLNHYFDTFLNWYNKSRNKEKYLNDNLAKIEEIFYSFIDDKRNEKWEIIEIWDKTLYWFLAEVYKWIWNYNKALEAYENWVESFTWNYFMYWKKWELYNESKIIWVDEYNSKKLAFKNFDEFLKNSQENNDIVNEVLALEWIADTMLSLNKDEAVEYYMQIIDKLNENNINIPEIEDRVIKRILENSDNEIDNHYYIKSLLILDVNNLLYIWEYFEKKWNLEYAFLNYLEAFEYNLKWAKEKLLNFLENTLIEKIKKEYEDFDFEGNPEIFEEIKKEAKEKNLSVEDLKNSNIEIDTIKVAVKNLKKFWNLFRADKVNIFLNSIDADFLSDLTLESVVPYINKYNLELEYNKNKEIINNNSIFLSEIIDFLSRQKFYDTEIISKLEEIYKKVYIKKELNDVDIKVILDSIEIKNNPNFNIEYIRNKIYWWKKLTKIEDDFLINQVNSDELYIFWDEVENYTEEIQKIIRKSFLDWNK